MRAHLAALGFTRDTNGGLVLPGAGKEVIRTLHSAQRIHITTVHSNFILKKFAKLQTFFANGVDVNPDKVAPRLERVVSDTWQSDLFKLASLTWSVPVSSGFGRRLRFLVWDNQNNKLIGLLAIGDPVFNLAVRDKFIGWSGIDRKERLVNLMDAYVLGALPPYNFLLGGKLVACLLRTKEIYNAFQAAYGNSTGIISKKVKAPQLLAVTTSSSMGRSSVYNRLRVGGIDYLKSLGYSGGWGHFHVPDDLFTEMREFLRDIGHKCADLHSFGDGPNWRIRTIRAAMDELGFKGDLLKHGIRREVFVSLLANNSIDILNCGADVPDLSTLQGADEVGRIACDRWLIPRAQSRPEFKAWERENILSCITRPNINDFELIDHHITA